MKKYTWVIILGVVVAGLLGYSAYYNSQPGELDGFAKCLDEQGAIFYGTFWCPHCQAQKASFGKSKDLLPYIECSTPDGRGQTDVCANENIESYPTWEFADGSRLSGEIPLETLAEKTGCTLPS